MIRKIVPVTDPQLRKRSKPVKKIDKKIKALVKDLKDTLIAQTDPEGVGLAAPQIGKNVCVFAMKPKDKIKIVINPKVLSISKEAEKTHKEKVMEGCLSLPHYYSPLTRKEKVKIKYTTEEGEEKVESFEGFPAQIVQHEIDHLEGIIFVDRLLEKKLPLYQLVNGDWEEVELT